MHLRKKLYRASPLWKDIRMELDAYWNYISFKLGNGERIELWKDVQIGLLFFSFLFYYLYLKVVNKNSFVASYWNQRYQECKI